MLDTSMVTLMVVSIMDSMAVSIVSLIMASMVFSVVNSMTAPMAITIVTPPSLMEPWRPMENTTQEEMPTGEAAWSLFEEPETTK